MRGVRLLTAVVIVIAILAPACSAPRKPYACVVETAASADVAEIWDCNREIMARAIRGRPFTVREFSRASEFFEEVTGIPADSLAGSEGRLPGPDLADDLARWDAWYAENGERLVWDPVAGRITEPGPDR